MQTIDAVRGSYSAALGVVVGYLQPQSYDRRVMLMAFTGPAGSAFAMYRGYQLDTAALMVTTSRGSRNTYDASTDASPALVRAGEAATLVWSGGSAIAGATSSATITSEVGG